MRRIETTLLDAFLAAGYGEVSTPSVEYEETLRRAGRGRVASSFHVQGERGEELALRSDMTIPIARLAASRYGPDEMPLRFCSVAPAYRAVAPNRGQAREHLQAGIELIGGDPTSSCAEAISLLAGSLQKTGLKEVYIGIGDAALYPEMLQRFDVGGADATGILEALAARNFVEMDRLIGLLDIGSEAAGLLSRIPRMRGPKLLENCDEEDLDPSMTRIRDVVDALEPGVANRVIIDLGRCPRMSYYTGIVFEAYDASLGEPVASGGHYGELLSRFGREGGGVGFAVVVDLVHAALAGESRGETGP